MLVAVAVNTDGGQRNQTLMLLSWVEVF
jgi:hypothetical protein